MNKENTLSLPKRVSLEYYREIVHISSLTSYLNEAFTEIDNNDKDYPLLTNTLFNVRGGDEAQFQFAELFQQLRHTSDKSKVLVYIKPEPFELHEGDLVIGKNDTDVTPMFVEDTYYSNGKPITVLLTSSHGDIFYADESSELPKGGDLGTMDDFFEHYRLLAKKENLLVEDGR